MSACVLPLAPDFQDPPAAQNYAPFIVEADPPVGSVVTSKMFRITVRDPNRNDDFHVRWEADYPPFNAVTTRPLNDPQEVVPHPADALAGVDLTKTVDCSTNALSTTIPRHQITVLIADRPFVTDATDPYNLGKVSPDGFVTAASWTLNLECVPPP